MKAMHKIYPLVTLAYAILLASCGSVNDVATNYYSDGIYFDPEYGNVIAETDEPEQNSATPSDRFDYYEPGTYSNPYEQPLNNSGWNTGYGMNNCYSPWGWNTSMNFYLGYTWGTPGWGYPYDPYYGMYSPYYGYSGWGYPGWNMGMGYGWGYPYYPGWGYPNYGYPGWGYYPGYGAGYYPGYGYGNDYGYFSNNQPDVLIRGNSTVRGGRDNTGSGVASQRIPNKTGKTTLLNNTNRYTGTQTQQVNKTTSTRSRLRNQYQGTTATYPAATPNTNAVRNQVENRNLYEKTVRNTAGSNPSTNATTNRAARMQQQTNRVLNNNNYVPNSGVRSRSYNTRTQGRTRTYNSGEQNTRSYSPSRSTNGGSSRSSGSSSTRTSSGGGVRGGRR